MSVTAVLLLLLAIATLIGIGLLAVPQRFDAGGKPLRSARGRHRM